MDATRFEELATAYGADVRRWPEADRASAWAFAAAEPTAVERVLAEAAALDALLAAAPAPIPGQALRDAVLASAPRPRPERRGLRGWFLLPGAGLAAACAIGALAGGFAVRHAVSEVSADTVLVASADAGDVEGVELS